MPVELPDTLATYFAIGNGGDASLLSTCFASDATVFDEKRVHRGLPAIAGWLQAAREAYACQAEPLSVARDGETFTVAARVEGRFPGSPITLRHAFVLKEGRIVSLEIG